MFTKHIYLLCRNKPELALNNLQYAIKQNQNFAKEINKKNK